MTQWLWWALVYAAIAVCVYAFLAPRLGPWRQGDPFAAAVFGALWPLALVIVLILAAVAL